MDQTEYLESIGLNTVRSYGNGINMILIDNILFFFTHPGISYILFDEIGTVLNKVDDFNAVKPRSWKGLDFNDFIIGCRYNL